RFHYESQREIPNLHFGLRIYSKQGVLLSDVHTWTTRQPVPLATKGKGTIDLEIDFLNLMPGTYYLGIWASSHHEWHDVLEDVAQLDVQPSDYYGTGRGVEARFGLVFFPFRWKVPAEECIGRNRPPLDHSTQGHRSCNTLLHSSEEGAEQASVFPRKTPQKE